jgi:phosphoribosylanthranilate isomerase
MRGNAARLPGAHRSAHHRAVRRVRIKVCCIASLDEAALAIAAGADALGLVSDMPSGPGVIGDELAREIARAAPPPIGTFLLTSRERADDIADHVHACETSTVQVVRHVDPAIYPRLVERLPRAVRRVQVIHVEDERALELASRYAPFVHAFLLDSGRPSAAIAELGGTGRVHDWAISREVVRRSRRPVFLAGGLRASNVRDALTTVAPYGIDVCSGVRTDGALDPAKLAALVDAARA